LIFQKRSVTGRIGLFYGTGALILICRLHSALLINKNNAQRSMFNAQCSIKDISSNEH